MGDLQQQVNGGVISQRHGFGETEIEATSEVSPSAIAEREKAMIQAMYIMAERRPRNMNIVRKKLLQDCERPGFAELARYRKPVGKKKMDDGSWVEQYAEGWSIRFAESALMHLGNIMLDERVVSEDGEHIGMRYIVADLESNVVKCGEKRFSKTVERSTLKKGQSAISERTNSKGEKTFTVAATEDDLGNKIGSSRSKFHRGVVQFVPGDVLDECMVRIWKTLEEIPPAEGVQKILTGFAAYKVQRADLEMFLRHDVFKSSGAEIQELREIFAAIKTGEAKWEDIVDSRAPKGTTDDAHRVGEEKLAAMKAAMQQNMKPQPKPEPQPAAEVEPEPEYSQETQEMLDPEDTPFETRTPSRKPFSFKR